MVLGVICSEKNKNLQHAKTNMLLASQANFYNVLNIHGGKTTIDSITTLINRLNNEK